MVAANDSEKYTPEQAQKRLNTSKGLRAAGQAIFLVLTLGWVLLVANAYRKTVARRLGSRAKRACIVLSVIGFFLIARGVFGVLQAAIWSVSRARVGSWLRLSSTLNQRK